MFKHKKVTHIVLAVFMALCLFMGPFAFPVKAEEMTWEYNFYHVSNNIRATCSGYHDVSPDYYIYNDPTNTKYRMVVEVNFGADAVTGSFTLGLGQLARGDVVVTENCTMTSNLSSTSVTFSVSGVNWCKIEVYSASYQRGLTSFTGEWNRYTSQELTTLNQIKTYVDGVETQLSNIIKTNHENYLSSAWIWASKQDSSFPRVKYGMYYMNYSSSNNNSEYDASHGIRLANGYSYTMIFYSNKALTSSNVSVYYSAVTGSVQVSTLPIVEINSQLYLLAFTFKNTNNGFSSFEPEFDQDCEIYPLYFGLNNNVPDDIRALLGQEYDNTYTRLLQQISDGIAGLESDQTVIDNSTNITNNFNTDMTTINNIEVSILTGIDNKFDAVDTAIDDSGVLDVYIDQSHDRWVNYMSGVVLDNLTIVKYPIYIILVGFVLLCLLG